MTRTIKVILGILGLILVMISIPIVSFIRAAHKCESNLNKQIQIVMNWSEDYKKQVLAELKRLDQPDYHGTELPPSSYPTILRECKVRRIIPIRDDIWVDLGYCFDAGVNLNATKSKNELWELILLDERTGVSSVIYSSHSPNE